MQRRMSHHSPTAWKYGTVMSALERCYWTSFTAAWDNSIFCSFRWIAMVSMFGSSAEDGWESGIHIWSFWMDQNCESDESPSEKDRFWEWSHYFNDVVMCTCDFSTHVDLTHFRLLYWCFVLKPLPQTSCLENSLFKTLANICTSNSNQYTRPYVLISLCFFHLTLHSITLL